MAAMDGELVSKERYPDDKQIQANPGNSGIDVTRGGKKTPVVAAPAVVKSPGYGYWHSVVVSLAPGIATSNC